jgi:hypothetical protein
VVLFHHVIEILDLADADRGAVLLVIAFDSGFIGLAAIDGDLFGHAVVMDRFLEKAQRRFGISVLGEQKVNRLALRVNRAIQIPPLPFDADVGLVHPPAAPHRALAAVERLFELWAIFQDPAVDRRVVNGHAALLHQFFDMPITQECDRFELS